MTYKEFYRITKNLDRNKYHTNCSINSDLKTCEWVILRKDMPWEEYWSDKNKAILNSKINTKEDLINFCKKNKKKLFN